MSSPPDGRPLVLVPRDWARPVLLMSAGRFYEKTVLDYAQLERAMGRSKTTGKLILPRKKDLKRQQGLARGRDTNATVTLRAYEHEKRDLLEDFREFVDAKYRPLDDDVLGRKLRLR